MNATGHSFFSNPSGLNTSVSTQECYGPFFLLKPVRLEYFRVHAKREPVRMPLGETFLVAKLRILYCGEKVFVGPGLYLVELNAVILSEKRFVQPCRFPRLQLFPLVFSVYLIEPRNQVFRPADENGVHRPQMFK